MNATPTISLVKDEAVKPAETPEATAPAETAQAVNPHADILTQVLAEHPEWEDLISLVDRGDHTGPEYPAPAYLDDEPSLRVQFGQDVAANLAGYQQDQRDLQTWHDKAWQHATENLPLTTAASQ